MQISTELRNRVWKKIDECLVISFGEDPWLLEKYRKEVKVQFSEKLGVTAGYATYRTKLIELNTVLFLENTEEFFNRTIPHEVAHLVVNELYPTSKQNHGPEFRLVMSTYNADPKTYHTYNTDSVRKPKKLFVYTCTCKDNVFKFSTRMHNSIVKEKQIRGCRTCEVQVKFTGKSVFM
jgi:SprT protein